MGYSLMNVRPQFSVLLVFIQNLVNDVYFLLSVQEQDIRHGLKYKGIFTERFRHKSIILQHRSNLIHQRSFFRTQMQYFWKQQRLGVEVLSFTLYQKFLIQNPLVGVLLVHDHYSRFDGTDDVTIFDLNRGELLTRFLPCPFLPGRRSVILIGYIDVLS